MGKKYIVELGRCERLYKASIDGNGKPELAWLSPEVDLKPYTEPGLEKIRKEAYDKGYHDGHNVCYENAKDLMEEKKNEAYQHGLVDAWETARKIAKLDTIPPDVLIKMFGNDPYSLIGKIFEVYSASEVVARIKAWEEEQKEQKEIKVGDEVSYYSVADEHGNVCYSGIVLEIRKDDYLVLEKDGKTYQLKKKLHVMSKTGRHCPEIATVLQKM